MDHLCFLKTLLSNKSVYMYIYPLCNTCNASNSYLSRVCYIIDFNVYFIFWHHFQGISFLELKYQLLLSYLTNLTYISLQKSQGSSIQADPAVGRLIEIRTVSVSSHVLTLYGITHTMVYTLMVNLFDIFFSF